MLATQKQAIERLGRVQDFLAVHPPPESPGYTAQKKVLDEVVQGLKEFSLDQALGRRLRRGEVVTQRALVGGRAGIDKEIGRGRKALAGLDAIVKRAFRDQPDVLEEWRTARRLRGLPG